MCIKNHTHCSVESVTERRQQPLHCRQSVNRSTGCRSLKHHTRLPRVSEDRGTPFRDGLKTCCSETSTAQHIIYNTNRAVWSPSSCENFSATRTLELLFPSPVPPRKKINNPPQTSPHQISHHQCTYPGIDPIGKPPSINPVHRTTAKDSYPEPASDRSLTTSRTRISRHLPKGH